MTNKIWLSPPHLSGHEMKSIQSTLESNWIAPQGPSIDGFESDIQQFLATEKEVVALNSGTSALHLALRLLGVKENDTVLCQSLTFVATANAISYLKARPVFIDSESDTWNLCPILLEQAIKDSIKKGQHPKAIIAVCLYGMPYNVRKIREISEQYKIPVVEDSAEALGSQFEDQKCGTFGDFSVFSFNGNKIITTSGGGALICKNSSEKQQAIYFSTQANDESDHYNHQHVGYNYRLSNVLASIGRSQMKVLEQRIRARRQNFENYKNAFASLDQIVFQENHKGYSSNRWLTCILLPTEPIKTGLLETLRKHQIDARSVWKPMHQQPIYSMCPKYINGISDQLYARGICLPSGSNLNEDEFNYVVTTVKNYLTTHS